MENYRDELLVIFAGYIKRLAGTKIVLSSLFLSASYLTCPGLFSLISYKCCSFLFYSHQNYKCYFNCFWYFFIHIVSPTLCYGYWACNSLCSNSLRNLLKTLFWTIITSSINNCIIIQLKFVFFLYIFFISSNSWHFKLSDLPHLLHFKNKWLLFSCGTY